MTHINEAPGKWWPLPFGEIWISDLPIVDISAAEALMNEGRRLSALANLLLSSADPASGEAVAAWERSVSPSEAEEVREAADFYRQLYIWGWDEMRRHEFPETD